MGKELDGQKAVTVSSLIQQCNYHVAIAKKHDPRRLLLQNCAMALRQLVDRLALYEPEGVVPGPEEPQ